MRVFILLTTLISAVYSQNSCKDAGLLQVSTCENLPTATDAPCGCTCVDANGDGVCDGSGDSRCVVASCPSTTNTPSCFCPTDSPLTTKAPTTTYKGGKSKGKSKSKGGSGLGIGQCDCNGGVAEIRYVWQGTETNVNIKLYNKNSDTLICEYNDVNPNDEIICNLRGDAPGLAIAPNAMSKFETETPFIVTYTNGGTCAAQYHTSCSSDIVGIPQPECPELIVSGWRDNDGYALGYDCDDGFEPCTCDDSTTSTTTTTTPKDGCPDIIFGNFCYCSTTSMTSSTTSTTVAPASKAGKSKGKSKGGAGLGVGDCDCEGGQIDLTVMYQGGVGNTVNIKCFYKDGSDLNGNVNSVQIGEEFKCTVEGTGYSKLGTETFVRLYDSNTNNELCYTQIHTSCSRDIVGTYGEGTCGNAIIVSGWRDGNNGFNGEQCDDGFDICPCDCDTSSTTTTTTGEQPPITTTTTTITTNEPEVTIGEVCYCSTLSPQSSTTTTSSLAPNSKGSKSKSSKSKGKSKGGEGLGVGDCDCDGGQIDLTVMYQGTNSNEVGVKCLNRKDNDGELNSDVNSVRTGEEFTCTVEGTGYSKLGTETLVILYNINNNERICNTQIHTSCSRDIVGTIGAESGQGTFCDSQLIVTGWRDGNNFNPNDPTFGNRCDDGFEECPCTTVIPTTTTTTTTTTTSNCPQFVPSQSTCDSYNNNIECCPDSYCSTNDIGDGMFLCVNNLSVVGVANNNVGSNNGLQNGKQDNKNVFESMTNKGGPFYKSIMFYIIIGIGLIIGVAIGVLIGMKCKAKNNYDKAIEMQIGNIQNDTNDLPVDGAQAFVSTEVNQV